MRWLFAIHQRRSKRCSLGRPNIQHWFIRFAKTPSGAVKLFHSCALVVDKIVQCIWSIFRHHSNSKCIILKTTLRNIQSIPSKKGRSPMVDACLFLFSHLARYVATRAENTLKYMLFEAYKLLFTKTYSS